MQVELHFRQKKVMILCEKVDVAGNKYGATEDTTSTNMNGVMIGNTTSFMGRSTPIHGGATPGGATLM